METDSPFGRLADTEVEALVQLLETGERKVLVLVIAVEGDEVAMVRSASAGTTACQARDLLEGVQHQADRIAERIGSPQK